MPLRGSSAVSVADSALPRGQTLLSFSINFQTTVSEPNLEANWTDPFQINEWNECRPLEVPEDHGPPTAQSGQGNPVSCERVDTFVRNH